MKIGAIDENDYKCSDEVNLPKWKIILCNLAQLGLINFLIGSNPDRTQPNLVRIKFEIFVLNRDVLSVAIVHQVDVYSEDPVYVPSDCRKAACIYRQ